MDLRCLRLGVDDINKRRLQASTTNKETVNVSLGSQLLAILLVNTAAIDDSGLVRRLLAHVVLQPLADGGMDLLRLFRGCDLAGTDGPNGLVCNDYLAPVANLISDCFELCCYDIDCLVAFALFEGLAAAPDDADAAVERCFGFAGDKLCNTLSQPMLCSMSRHYISCRVLTASSSCKIVRRSE